MSALPVTRRRAEAFDVAVRDGVDAPDARTADLLALVTALRASSAPAPRPAFVDGLREQLMRVAETELRPATRPVDRTLDRLAPPDLPHLPSVRPVRERRLAAALAGFALVGASVTMAVAAQTSLPGDTLYPLKRAIEEADTTLRADGDQGRRLLEHASSRLLELQAVSDPDRDAVEVPVLESTLDTFTEQADDGSVELLDDYAESGDQGAVGRVHDFTAESLETLGRLEPVLPDAVRPALMDAAQTLVRIDAAADRACPECAAGGIVEIPSVLLAATALDLGAAEPQEAVLPPGTAPAGPSRTPGRAVTRQPSTSPSTRPAPAPEPPATAPTTPRPPADTSLPTPPSARPPSAVPTRDGLVEDLVDTLTGGGQGPATGTPAPPPVLPELGGVLQDGSRDPAQGPLLP